jgi:hypothetical protein
MLKTDSLGDTLWSFRSPYKAHGVACVASDYSYFVATCTAGPPSVPDEDMLIFRLDTLGSVLSRTYYRTPSWDIPNAVAATDDGGCIVAGLSSDTVTDGLCLFRLEADGRIAWLKAMQGARGSSVQQTRDGGFVVAGLWDDTSGADCFIAKTDKDGNTEWTKVYGHGNSDQFADAKSVHQAEDGGYAVVGWGRDLALSRTSAYMIRTDSLGDSLWSRFYGIDGYDCAAHCVRQTSDGGFVVVGWAYRWDPPAMSVHLVKTGADGEEQWTRLIPPAGGNAWGVYVRQTADLGYVLVGASASNMYMVKTDSLGMYAAVGDASPVPPECRMLDAGPSPFRQRAVIRYSVARECDVTLRMYSSTGSVVAVLREGRQVPGEYSYAWDVRGAPAAQLPSGAYFCRLEAGEFKATRKIVLLR